MDISQYDDIMRSLTATMVHQRETNDHLRAVIDNHAENMRAINVAIEGINASIESIDTTLRDVKTILAYVTHQSENGKD